MDRDSQGKFVDINMKDNVFTSIGHTLGFLNYLTPGGNVDFSTKNLSLRFSGGWYSDILLTNGVQGNSLFDVAWTKNTVGNTVITNDNSLAGEEFAHVWQSRFFSGMGNFWIPYMGNIALNYFVNDGSMWDAYRTSFFEIQAKNYDGRKKR